MSSFDAGCARAAIELCWRQLDGIPKGCTGWGFPPRDTNWMGIQIMKKNRENKRQDTKYQTKTLLEYPTHLKNVIQTPIKVFD